MCHLNLNSVVLHNFSKIQALITYNCIHKFDIIYLSESYLNSEILSSDSNLQIARFNFARMNHPSNSKRGGVCLYYKCSLPLKVIDVSYLQECINFQVKIGDKTRNFVSLYRSPSQTKDEFENFIKNLEINLEHIANESPFLLGNFNARMQGRYQNDITTSEGCKIDIATSQFGLSQIIKQPTHILSNSNSCIDLIFISQPYISTLVMHSGVHPPLYWNCHHQIIFSKFNPTTFYLATYKRLVWHYQQSNTYLIKQAIELFNWEKSLSNLDANKQVFVFNETIMNIFKNFIPHETITSNDKDPPWWINKLEHLLQKKTVYINVWSKDW